MTMIIGREGEQKMPINDRTVSRQHLEVTPLQDGRYKIRNIGKNGTFVNGVMIDECIVSADTELRLGSTFKASLHQLMTGKPAPARTDISHLKGIYERYSKDKAELRKAQMRVTYYRYLATGLMVLCGALGYITREYDNFKSIRTIAILLFVPIGIVLIIYTTLYQKRLVKEQPDKENSLVNKFKTDYVCPKCKKFLGDQPYEGIVQQGRCPYCQTLWKKE